MSKRLIVIVLAAAASLALVLWFALGLGSGRERGSQAAGKRVAGGTDVAPVAAQRGNLAAPRAEAAEPEIALPAPDETRAESSRRASAHDEELAKARWVSGRLLFPQGTPLDEKVFLTARGRDFEHAPEHRVEVQADGSFRLAFSEKTRRGSIAMEARYLYLEASVRVDFDDELAPLVLEPALGGRIQGRLSLPEEGRLSLADLAGSSVSLQHTTRRGNTSSSEQVRAARIEGPTFEFSGIPIGGEYSADLQTDLAYARESGTIVVQAGKTSEFVLELRAGAAIEGRVLDEQGAPLAEIGVQVQSRDQGRGLFVWRHATSAADGTYRVRGLPPGEVTVESDTPGFEDAERELDVRPEDEVLSGIDLVLTRGFQITGRVRWPDGTPAAGATIEVKNEQPGSWLREEFACEEDGTFVAGGLGEASYRVEARGLRTEEVRETSPITGKERTKKKRTTWRAMAEDVRAGAAGLELVLDPGLVLAGLVRDDLGRPLDDFEVEATPQRDPNYMGEVHFQGYRGQEVLHKSFKDAGGRFELVGFTAGAWSVAAKAKGHSASFALEVRAPDELGQEVELVVQRSGRIAGVVVDPGGRGVAGAEVTWVRSDSERGWTSFDDDAGVKTDGAGLFVLEEVDPGAISLRATCETAAPSEALVVELEPGGFLSEVELRLRRGGRITGQVVDAAGAGLPGREVDLWGFEAGGRRDTMTDAGGRFAFENLPGGNYRLSSDPTPEEALRFADTGSQDLNQLLKREVDVELEEEGSTDVILAPPSLRPVTLHGRVTAARKPLSKAFLWASSESGQNTNTETDSDGDYEIVLGSPGHHEIHVNSRTSGLQSSVEVDVPEVARFAFDIEIASGAVSGRVFAPDGSPLAGIEVYAEQPVGQDGGWPSVGGQATTGADGRYRIEVPAGTYDVVAGKSQPWESASTSFAPGRSRGISVASGSEVEGIEITLRRGGSIEGRVALRDGGALAMAWIWVVDGEGENVGTQGTDGTGKFRVDGLEPGTLRVQAADNENRLSGWHPVEVRVGETTRIDLTLDPATNIHARVVDASGTPIEVETVELLDAQGTLLQAGFRTEDGLYWLGAVTSGSYVVRATHLGKTVEREARAAGEAELTVELRID